MMRKFHCISRKKKKKKKRTLVHYKPIQTYPLLHQNKELTETMALKNKEMDNKII